ncbi:MAG: hypothetical protein AAGI30_01645 [Planctomycetota bacterium]
MNGRCVIVMSYPIDSTSIKKSIVNSHRAVSIKHRLDPRAQGMQIAFSPCVEFPILGALDDTDSFSSISCTIETSSQNIKNNLSTEQDPIKSLLKNRYLFEGIFLSLSSADESTFKRAPHIFVRVRSKNHSYLDEFSDPIVNRAIGIDPGVMVEGDHSQALRDMWSTLVASDLAPEIVDTYDFSKSGFRIRADPESGLGDGWEGYQSIGANLEYDCRHGIEWIYNFIERICRVLKFQSGGRLVLRLGTRPERYTQAAELLNPLGRGWVLETTQPLKKPVLEFLDDFERGEPIPDWIPIVSYERKRGGEEFSHCLSLRHRDGELYFEMGRQGDDQAALLKEARKLTGIDEWHVIYNGAAASG